MDTDKHEFSGMPLIYSCRFVSIRGSNQCVLRIELAEASDEECAGVGASRLAMKAALRRQLVFVYFVFLVVVNLPANSVRQSLTYGPNHRHAKSPGCTGQPGLESECFSSRFQDQNPFSRARACLTDVSMVRLLLSTSPASGLISTSVPSPPLNWSVEPPPPNESSPSSP